MINDKRIEQIEERLNNAVSGPWRYEKDETYGVGDVVTEYNFGWTDSPIIICEVEKAFQSDEGKTGDFLAHSWQDIKDLIAFYRQQSTAVRQAIKQSYLDAVEYIPPDCSGDREALMNRMREVLGEEG